MYKKCVNKLYGKKTREKQWKTKLNEMLTYIIISNGINKRNYSV